MKSYHNCYSYAAGCYSDAVAETIDNRVTGIESWFELIEKIAPRDVPSHEWKRGDLIVFGGHIALATGKEDIVSHFGLSANRLQTQGELNSLRRFGDHEAMPVVEQLWEKAHPGERFWNEGPHEVRAQWLVAYANLGGYKVYRIQTGYQDKMTCQRLQERRKVNPDLLPAGIPERIPEAILKYLKKHRKRKEVNARSRTTPRWSVTP